MDFDTFLQSSKMAINLIDGSAGAAKKIKDLLAGAKEDPVPSAEITTLTFELLDKLIEAKQAQFAILESIGPLKDEMIEIQRRLEFQSGYEPFTTDAGALVLVPKPRHERDEAPHYLCPDCATKGNRSFLQPDGTGKRCYPCDRFFPFEDPTGGPMWGVISKAVR